ncbi:MAG: hypothetical protein RLZZ131_66, partial [Actinomycetota bacterium]
MAGSSRSDNQKRNAMSKPSDNFHIYDTTLRDGAQQ